MSYTKREWATGNVVGAVDLNRMEQGIEDSRGILVVNSVYNENNGSYTLNKTWQEIYDAFPFVIEYYNENGTEGKSTIHQVNNSDGVYFVDGIYPYATFSASSYPTTSTNSGSID
jgi:hypothetical protein